MSLVVAPETLISSLASSVLAELDRGGATSYSVRLVLSISVPPIVMLALPVRAEV